MVEIGNNISPFHQFIYLQILTPKECLSKALWWVSPLYKPCQWWSDVATCWLGRRSLSLQWPQWQMEPGQQKALKMVAQHRGFHWMKWFQRNLWSPKKLRHSFPGVCRENFGSHEPEPQVLDKGIRKVHQVNKESTWFIYTYRTKW